ncbi:hypothetical protein LWI28_011895 [Acer negundo]|uniref:Cysteine-rich transmembrane domain-containing protein n=1 Tax=Acer negundo TaxID=4023 RepID=A0AAD5JDP4_ACENE|nr:hypothetical protein LWI28_011895 [Acer negundo]
MEAVHSGEKNQPFKAHDHPEKQKTGKKIKCPMCAPCATRFKKKGNGGFFEGCLAALCCCWVCDMCFDCSVVVVG